ncbi:MAG: holo-ACP synthase [Alphaproteobacteria bacterium]
MILVTGFDLAEIERVARAVDGPHGERFRERVFTAGERRWCDARGRGRTESYAARFAAKEAVMKALGVGWGKRAGWLEIEVLRDPGAAPRIALSGRALETARGLGVERLHLSISHAGGIAAAFVVAEGAAPSPTGGVTPAASSP